MVEVKKVSVASRTEAPEQDKSPRKKPRTNMSKEFKYYPFEDALRHLVIKEKK